MYSAIHIGFLLYNPLYRLYIEILLYSAIHRNVAGSSVELPGRGGRQVWVGQCKASGRLGGGLGCGIGGGLGVVGDEAAVTATAPATEAAATAAMAARTAARSADVQRVAALHSHVRDAKRVPPGQPPGRPRSQSPAALYRVDGGAPNPSLIFDCASGPPAAFFLCLLPVSGRCP